MSIHFHSLRVQAIQRETADCVAVVLEIPAHLKEEFKYTHGQSVTMRTTIAGEEIRRTYSICSCPLDHELTVAIKKQPQGLFSSFANDQLQVNDYIDVMPPVGKFNTPLDPTQSKNYLAFAAGSGITPILSIIKTTLRTEPKSAFTLVYGNQTRASVIFFEELEALKNQYIDRFNLIHILSREKMETDLHAGRITKEKCTALFNKLLPVNNFDDFFICGPEAMIFTVRDSLIEHGVAEKKIHFELFTTPGTKQTTTAVEQNNNSNQTAVSNITIKIDGRSIDFNIPFGADTSILDAAMQKGADVPYACKGGVCCTCKAKLLEGQVRMDVHWGLEQEEIEQGFILTCQSHPTTATVVVDFDIK